MSRRKQSQKRVFEADYVYKSTTVTRFINKVMVDGKKSVAEGVVYGALERLGKEVPQIPLDAFNVALRNVIPLMEVKSRRVGGSTYQVPMEVRGERGLALGMKWIIQNARSRSGKGMVERLSQELVDAFNNVGASVKKREDTHKMADANKAFAHFRW